MSYSSLVHLLLRITQFGMGIFVLLITYFLVLSALGGMNLLPKYFDASFEIPVSLENPEEYYKVLRLSEHFSFHEIEIKKANVEVRPIDRSWPQSLGYLHAALYISFFGGMLLFLSQILKSFQARQPFSTKNVGYLQNIGYLAIALGIYEFLLMLFVSQYFHSKVEILHGNPLEYPLIESLNFVAIFLGLVILTLAEVFRHGAALQEFEDHTV